MPEFGFYSIKEVAEVLKLPVSGVRELIRNGELKVCRFSERRTRIDEEDLIEFIRKAKRQKDGPKLHWPCSCED